MWLFGAKSQTGDVQREVGSLAGWVYQQCVASETGPELRAYEERCVLKMQRKLLEAFKLLQAQSAP